MENVKEMMDAVMEQLKGVKGVTLKRLEMLRLSAADEVRKDDMNKNRDAEQEELEWNSKLQADKEKWEKEMKAIEEELQGLTDEAYEQMTPEEKKEADRKRKKLKTTWETKVAQRLKNRAARLEKKRQEEEKARAERKTTVYVLEGKAGKGMVRIEEECVVYNFFVSEEFDDSGVRPMTEFTESVQQRNLTAEVVESGYKYKVKVRGVVDLDGDTRTVEQNLVEMARKVCKIGETCKGRIGL